MSKEPEVGDVFESPFAKYLVILNYGDYCHCVAKEKTLTDVRKPATFYLTDKCKYIGKSKYKIEDLFKTENE